MPMTTQNYTKFHQNFKKNRLFIIGAGFSVDAGIPLTEELLTKSLRKFSSECPGVFSRVHHYASILSGVPDDDFECSNLKFSDLCTFLEFIELREFGGGERFSVNGSREKLALRFFLAKTIVENTPSIDSLPKIYIDFANQLHMDDIVISFNWDCLLEKAIIAVGKRYTYNFSDDDAIKICKLHGSINWRLGESSCMKSYNRKLDWQSMGFTKGIMNREIYHSSNLLEYSNWLIYPPLNEVDPFLVLPGYGKAFDVRFNAALWYKIEDAFVSTNDVYIIGLSLAEDDFFVRSFFLANLPYLHEFSAVNCRKITVINPGKDALKDYSFVFQYPKVELINRPFGLEHVEIMITRLTDV